MSNADELAEKAMEALRGDDPVAAARALQDAIAADPERLDLIHALAVTELRLGEPASALALTEQGERIARSKADDSAGMLMPQLLLARAAACEDLQDPAGAAAAFAEILQHEPQNPRARQGLGHLLLGWGRVEAGLAELDAYLADAQDEEQFLEATADFAERVRAFSRDDIHPVELLNAHRGSYVEFFDHHANRLQEEGWIAEAARMHRDEDGNVVLSVPDGAPEWAGVRVDLVNPQTGQPGRIGDQPMVVALADYEALAQAPILFQWPARDHAFEVWVSTQSPWNHLRVQIELADAQPDPVAALIDVIGDWYRAGFDGAFGTHEAGRFHEIDDLVAINPKAVMVHLDAGRSEVRAVNDLLKRLEVLHSSQPVARVVIGRGYLPSET